MADRALIIAEAGVNHNGSLELAMRLIDAAVDTGADVVKFQTFQADKLATGRAAKADYQVANTQDAGSQVDMLRSLELSADDHRALAAHCEAQKIGFMSTAFDSDSLGFLAGFDMPALKIPSGDISCAPLLLQAARLRCRLIISTGMSDLADIEAALGVVALGLTCDDEPRGREDFVRAYASDEGRNALEEHVTLLHCVSHYPASVEAVNLRAMATLTTAFGLSVGYSDHTLGIEVAIAAVALGATVIEKHLTLDKSLQGPDHAASLDPEQFKQMVVGIRTVEGALGSPIKKPAGEEWNTRLVARRSVVAARPIAAGEIIRADMLAFKRPGDGVSPLDFWSFVGREAPRAFAEDEQIWL